MTIQNSTVLLICHTPTVRPSYAPRRSHLMHNTTTTRGRREGMTKFALSVSSVLHFSVSIDRHLLVVVSDNMLTLNTSRQSQWFPLDRRFLGQKHAAYCSHGAEKASVIGRAGALNAYFRPTIQAPSRRAPARCPLRMKGEVGHPPRRRFIEESNRKVLQTNVQLQHGLPSSTVSAYSVQYTLAFCVTTSKAPLFRLYDAPPLSDVSCIGVSVPPCYLNLPEALALDQPPAVGLSRGFTSLSLKWSMLDPRTRETGYSKVFPQSLVGSRYLCGPMRLSSLRQPENRDPLVGF